MITYRHDEETSYCVGGVSNRHSNNVPSCWDKQQEYKLPSRELLPGLGNLIQHIPFSQACSLRLCTLQFPISKVRSVFELLSRRDAHNDTTYGQPVSKHKSLGSQKPIIPTGLKPPKMKCRASQSNLVKITQAHDAALIPTATATLHWAAAACI